MENQHRRIKGYRELNEDEVHRINVINEMGVSLHDLISAVEFSGGDKRWTAIARTDLQKGLMALTRAVAKPDFF